ncbi:conserved hypothetical protein [Paecilomyces variotii No. 5]|uniref:Uncharacterized protein n=1 Tax=Byssochlamys spectabilis (strain No. 5 / NBRC 109023) TaxID=1356009 RepID=V5G3P2_BYSSN|nr:conserved hypothetical protein [Paecilomyces variotii No. 5]
MPSSIQYEADELAADDANWLSSSRVISTPPPRETPVSILDSSIDSISDSPTLVRRAPAAATTSSGSCGPNDNSPQCEKPTSTVDTATLPVVLGAVIPIVCAIIVLIFLHRRHVKRLRNEDANDKHKSLDFGMDAVESGAGPRPGKPGGAEMSQAEKLDRKAGKGMSLDMVGSPYLLPPGLHGSRESLRSLSRSISVDDDKYRPATSFLGDNASMRSYSHFGKDDASSVGGASRLGGDDMNQNLLMNAQRMSQSSPPRVSEPIEAPAPVHLNPEEPSREPRLPSMAFTPQELHFPTTTPEHDRSNDLPAETTHTESSALPGQAVSATVHSTEPEVTEEVSHRESSPSSPELKSPFSVESFSAQMVSDSSGPSDSAQRQPPRISLPFSDAASDYGDMPKFDSDIPAVNIMAADEEDKQHQKDASDHREPASELAPAEYTYDTRRLTLGVRPLPPEDPSDNPEQRANRIRSFYKEYFDDNKQGAEGGYSEPFGPEFYGDAAVYDPTTGDIFTGPPRPWAEPVGRRAMTPPPRAPPRFQGGARHMPTGSGGGGFMSPGPRAFSSASGRIPGPPRGPRKPRPPPEPLHVLPTPHALTDDSLILPIDFAPPQTFKDQREGRPESPMGGLRPYSPGVRAHTPLASSFDDLIAMPSPYALRKSGTFTGLDFAPPPRFKNQDTASDAGSIRSNRTGISTAHANNIRMGAYRVSRLPADTVGTKDDLASSLRPKWDMNNP